MGRVEVTPTPVEEPEHKHGVVHDPLKVSYDFLKEPVFSIAGGDAPTLMETLTGAVEVSLYCTDGSELPRMSIAEMNEKGEIYWSEGEGGNSLISLARYWGRLGQLLYTLPIEPRVQCGPNVTPGVRVEDLRAFF